MVDNYCCDPILLGMSDYTNAPATALVATHCAACGRPLLDAVSVETGMGPHCRKQHGFGVAQSPAVWDIAQAQARAGGVTLEIPAEPTDNDARVAANRLVHRIAANQSAEGVPRLIAAVSFLGFEKVAKAIAEHLAPATVQVTVHPSKALAVRVEGLGERFDAFVAAMRSVPGRRWDGAEKVNVVPVTSRVALWEALRSVLPTGTVVVGNRIAVL